MRLGLCVHANIERLLIKINPASESHSLVHLLYTFQNGYHVDLYFRTSPLHFSEAMAGIPPILFLRSMGTRHNYQRADGVDRRTGSAFLLVFLRDDSLGRARYKFGTQR
jgi:hypothetical protein